MEKEDLWKCDMYFLQCSWYLNNLITDFEEGIITVKRNNKCVLMCKLYKHLNGNKTFTSFFSENVCTSSNYTQTRSNTYSKLKWIDILHHRDDIKWFDSDNIHYSIEPADPLDIIEPFPSTIKWNPSQFTSSSYRFLVSIIKQKEEGEVTVTIHHNKIHEIYLNKTWCERPLII